MTLNRHDARLRVLAALPALAGLRASRLRDLLTQFDEAEVPAGTVLARAGRPCAEMLVVVDGLLRAAGGAGVRELGPGEAWGWRELAERDANPATLVALTRARLLVMGRAQFRALAAVAATPGTAAPLAVERAS